MPTFCPYRKEDQEEIQKLGGIDSSKVKLCSLSPFAGNNIKSPCIPPVGDKIGGIMIVGEAPGQEEDEKGVPFVGASGQLLRETLASLGIKPGRDCVITNAVRCRPPQNKTPTATQVKLCSKDLPKLIQRMRPKVILALGKIALRALFGKDYRITAIVGGTLTYKLEDTTIPVVACYHPAFVLRRNNEESRTLFRDTIAKAVEYYRGGYNPSSTGISFELCATFEKAKEALEKLIDEPRPIAFDIETNGLDAFADDAKVYTASFSVDDKSAVVIPFEHPEVSWEPKQIGELKRLTAKVLDLSKHSLVIHNARFEYQWVRKYFGKDLRVRVGDHLLYDTLLLHHLYRPDMPHGLDTLVIQYCLDRFGVYWEEVEQKAANKKLGVSSKKIDYGRVPLLELAEYNAKDTASLHAILPKLWSQLNERQQRLYRNHEVYVLKLCALMEYVGIPLDTEYVRGLEDELLPLKQEIEQKVIALPAIQPFLEELDREGKEFKLSSPKQVATIIYDIYGCPLIEVKGKTGRSTAEDFIVALQREDISGEAKCFLELLLEHRKVSKQLSTYVDKAIEQWMSSDGFVHANFNPTGTETGRLSSSSPNLQNIPRGPRFRGMFVSRFEDGSILDVDYSQIEARVAACLSKDEMLCETFRSGEDFHRKNAALIFNVPYDAVTDEQRQEAKGLASFGLLYGKAAWSLAQDLNISEEVAQTYVDRYFSAAPRLKQWIEAVKELVAQRGYVTTPFGRVRYFPQYSSSSAKEVAEVKRAAVNTIIQSTAADLVKRAAYLIIAELQRRGLETVVWNVVHDSIVFDVPRAELDEVKVLAREIMEDMSRYSWAIIPFTVEFKENERRWK